MLSSKRILVTGANGGIGNAICKELLENNAKLALLYNHNRNKIDNLVENYANIENNIKSWQVDLLDSKKLENTLELILETGPIDIFVHCATLPVEPKTILDLNWEDYQSHIEIQTKSYLQIVKKLIPYMKSKHNGKIISILTSYVIGKPPSSLSHYLVGKYSLLGLSKALAVELGQFGISVNCISPSMVDTELTKKLPSKLKELTANQTPMKRLVLPEEISSVVSSLCSNNFDFISGENILISGGSVMH